MSQSLDAHREEVLDSLGDHFANERLSLEDFEDRTDKAARATSSKQLRELLADLPQFDDEGRRIIESSESTSEDVTTKTLEGTSDSLEGSGTLATGAALATTGGQRLSGTRALVPKDQVRDRKSYLAVFSQTHKKGRWQAARELRVKSVFGDAKLDFREAVLAPGLTEIRISSVFGSTKIIVPPDLPVETDGFAIFGDFSDHQQGAPDDPDAPHLRITGKAIFGNVEIAVKPQ